MRESEQRLGQEVSIPAEIKLPKQSLRQNIPLVPRVMQQEKESGEKSRRGFASMPPEKRRKIASMGGVSAHIKGTAHEWKPDEAKIAGEIGGEIVSQDRKHMSEIGSKGGTESAKRRREQKQEPIKKRSGFI